MAKNTRSQEVLTGTSDSYTEHEMSDPRRALMNRPVLGGEKLLEHGDGSSEVVGGDESSVGSNSPASSESESTESGSGTASPPHAAPTTENPSEQTDQGSSDAHTTGGSGPETDAQPSGKAPRKAATARKSVGPRKAAAPSVDDF